MSSITVRRAKNAEFLWTIEPDYYSKKLQQAVRKTPGMTWDTVSDRYPKGIGYVDAVDACVRLLASWGVTVDRRNLPTGPSSEHCLPVAQKHLREYQKAGVDFLVANAPAGAILADDMGCVDGDAIVQYYKNDEAYSSITLRELYYEFNNLDVTMFVRSFDGDKFVSSKIERVLDKGVKKVVLLKLTSDKNLRLTEDHEVLTRGGFLRADELKPGFMVQTSDGEEAVQSVTRSGETRVYDIVCADPHRNFVANGIVVHNCGKTIQSLVTARAFKMKTVVVCLSYVKGVWSRAIAGEKELKDWWPGVTFTVLEGVKNVSAIDPSLNLIVINYDIVYAWLPEILAWKPGGLIIDECHVVSNPKSRRSQSVKAIRVVCRWCAGLSGTPLTNRPRDLWGLTEIVSPGRFGENFFPYGLMFCEGHREEIEVKSE